MICVLLCAFLCLSGAVAQTTVTSRKADGLQRLYQKYPQMRTTEYGACFSAMQALLLDMNSRFSDLQFGAMFFTDLGSMEECERAGNSYVELNTNAT